MKDCTGYALCVICTVFFMPEIMRLFYFAEILFCLTIFVGDLHKYWLSCEISMPELR